MSSSMVCVLTVLAVTACAAAASAQGGERKGPVTLLAEGFEGGLDRWTMQGDAGFAEDTEQPHSGLRCARITVRRGTLPAYQQLNRSIAPVAHGDEIRATVWVRSAEVTGETGAYCALQFLDAGAQRVAIAHSKISLSNGRDGWELLVAEGTAPTGTTSARVDLILHGNGTAWFDDVEVVRTSQLDPWPDLGAAERTVDVDASRVVQARFGGVGFHVFDHAFDISKDHLEQVVAKRWRELNPSFARLNHEIRWDRAKLRDVAAHLNRLKETGTEVYLATWDPRSTSTDAERAEYARDVVDHLEYLVRDQGATNVRTYCMSNELSLDGWGRLVSDLRTFRAYHQALYDELRGRELDVGLLATDASPVSYWHTIEWAAANMDDITAVYGGHHYINDHPLDDERFYPWFLDQLRWAVGIARGRGKEFILGEFGAKQDGRTVDGVLLDRCVYFETDQEALVAIQLADAVIAALNAGVYALGYWTFMDLPDEIGPHYINKWGTFRWSGRDYSTRAIYYGYGLLTRFFRGPATVYAVETNDPYVRAAAVRHHEAGTWSVVVLNRYSADVPVSVRISGETLSRSFRKYVYDPADVPDNPFGDMQPPAAVVEMRDGVLHDAVAQGTMAVYTTAYDEAPPPPVRGLRVHRNPDGSRTLEWAPSTATDLCYYRVYRVAGPDSELTVERQLASTVATEYVDQNAPAGRQVYAVVAVDSSGNAGEPSLTDG